MNCPKCEIEMLMPALDLNREATFWCSECGCLLKHPDWSVKKDLPGPKTRFFLPDLYVHNGDDKTDTFTDENKRNRHFFQK